MSFALLIRQVGEKTFLLLSRRQQGDGWKIEFTRRFLYKKKEEGHGEDPEGVGSLVEFSVLGRRSKTTRRKRKLKERTFDREKVIKYISTTVSSLIPGVIPKEFFGLKNRLGSAALMQLPSFER